MQHHDLKKYLEFTVNKKANKMKKHLDFSKLMTKRNKVYIFENCSWPFSELIKLNNIFQMWYLISRILKLHFYYVCHTSQNKTECRNKQLSIFYFFISEHTQIILSKTTYGTFFCKSYGLRISKKKNVHIFKSPQFFSVASFY